MNERSITVQQIMAMLARRREIERGPYMQQHALGSARQNWVMDAVELLLQIELERHEEPRK